MLQSIVRRCRKFKVAQTPHAKELKQKIVSKKLYRILSLSIEWTTSNMTNADLQRREVDLMNKSLRELANGQEKNPIDKLRLICLARGATGIIGLSR